MSNATLTEIDSPKMGSHTQHQRILIIDDEAGIRDSLETLLMLEGFSVESAPDGQAGLDLLARHAYDLLLLDLALPGESGIDLLPRIKSLVPDLPVIMITAYGTVGNVVDAIRAGASNFVQKPWDNEKLLADIRAAIGLNRAEQEVVQLKRTLKQRYSYENIVGKSEPMLRLFDLVAQVAPSRSTVLIQGESGTGKELVAKAIHASSPRRDKPFIPVNTVTSTRMLAIWSSTTRPFRMTPTGAFILCESRSMAGKHGIIWTTMPRFALERFDSGWNPTRAMV